MQQSAYHNTKLIPQQNLRISIDDIGFSRCYTVFELLRCYGEHPFMLREHLQRMNQGLKSLRIHSPLSTKKIQELIQKLIRKHKFPDSFVKIYITGGITDIFGTLTSKLKPQVYILNYEFRPESPTFPFGRELYQGGIRLQTVRFERILPEVKTTIYAGAFTYIQAAKQAGFDDILYINQKGHLTESSTSNLFLVQGGKLITPREGALAGITRLAVLQLAKKLKITVLEKNIRLASLRTIDEAFVTSSTREIVPVCQINRIKLGQGKDFKVMNRLRKAFLEYISKNKRSNQN